MITSWSIKANSSVNAHISILQLCLRLALGQITLEFRNAFIIVEEH